ncbi:hypothetical protein [Salinilacihabitans rarus]|uniref:hypothetical protein n=1 Tax=Salinilacihabitans rarus TaxID=2961596 RepID=UPI0020C9120C|nr:hypothetical protein [Salinilacihabitans rarus]
MVLAPFFYLVMLLASVAGVFVGLDAVADGFARYRQAVTIADTPLSTLDAVAVGPAAVSGTVSADGSPLSLPADGRECVAYDLTVADDGYGSTRTPLEERRATAFTLETDLGRVGVSPAAVEGAEFDFTDDRRAERTVASYEEPSERVADFERSRDLPDRGMRYDRTFELAWIEPGDECYAFGRIDADAEFDSGDRKGAVLRDGDVTPFLSDKPPARLLRERRFALGRSVGKGLVLATVSLAAFLWLSGIAQLFLGA